MIPLNGLPPEFMLTHDPTSVGSGPETEQRLDWGEVANIALGLWDAHGPLGAKPEGTGMLAAPSGPDPTRPHVFIPSNGPNGVCGVCALREDEDLNPHGAKHVES